MSQELLDYIKQRKAGGASDEQIKQELLNSGWQEEVINQNLSGNIPLPQSSNPIPQVKALPSPWKLIKNTFSFYKTNIGRILGISIPPNIFLILLTYTGKEDSALLSFVVLSLFALAHISSKLALFAFVVKPGDGIVSAYKNGLVMFFAFIWINIISFFVGVGGFALLIIPGIILAVLLSQSYYVLFDEKIKGIAALIKSWSYTRGRLMAVFGRILVFTLIIALPVGLLTGNASPEKTLPMYRIITNLIINNLFFAPMAVIFGYLLFISLKETRTGDVTPEEASKIKKKIIIFSIVGMVVFLAIILLAGALIASLMSEALIKN